MPSTKYNCPNCENENKLILLGNDYGIFDRICKTCSSEIEVEINEEQSVSKVRSKKNTVNHFQEKKAVPKDYTKMKGDEPVLQKKESKKLKTSLK